MKKTQTQELYDPAKIEKKWQKKWASSKIYKSNDKNGGDKAYILDMFPYPSGEGLHVGHPKGYIATDVVSRMMRMQGKNVLHPMGFDAFGLPAENYAIKTKTNPMESVAKNVVRFKKQLEILGLDYDWSREINTTDPEYYRWTQWIFLQMWKKGLAYESKEPINWCPSCKTGLANEDVENGRCERCGTPVEKKPMRQWVLKITDYADRLLEDLDAVDDSTPLLDWPEPIKESQRNWIGRSEGAEMDFLLKTSDNKTRFVILHGYKGGAKTNFIPWLKRELENRGHEVEAPELPNTNDPRESEQVEYVLKNCRIDENTVIIGHSLGSAVAMKMLMKLGKKVSGLVLVAAAMPPEFSDKKKVRKYWDYFSWNDINYGRIGELTGGKIAILSDKREEHRIKYLRFLQEKLGAGLIETTSAEEHFCALEEPEILRAVTPTVRVFTTRPDTIFGATYLVLAPEHPWVKDLMNSVQNKDEILAYVDRASKETEIERADVSKDKTGVELKGVKAVNPINGNEIPVWIADYVLIDYGTGAIMAVPAHDERDSGFAKKFNLPVIKVIRSEQELYTGQGILENSGDFNGKKSEEVMKEISIKAGGEWVTKYKLRDWVFSRQRYWGEPIPLIHCEKCGVVAVPENELPVKLPKVKSYEPTGTGESPLATIDKWVNVKCPECKGKAKRETNTMPQWAGSSWYYLRYEDPKNKKSLVSPEKEKYWSPVDLYVGGAEHATRHLIYARFWHKFLYDIGVVSGIEPFRKLQNVGLIMGEDGRKMSKRFGNVVNPDTIVSTYGADTLRLYEMFMGPFDQQISWNTKSIVGPRRFIERVWKMFERVSSESTPNDDILHIINKCTKKVTEDIIDLHFNTAISSLMIAVNELERFEKIPRLEFEVLLRLLAPFVPHVTDELWLLLGNRHSIHVSKWPDYDPAMTMDNRITVVVQVNGKVRAKLEVERGVSKENIENMARNEPRIAKVIEGQMIKKVIVVPDKIINIVF